MKNKNPRLKNDNLKTECKKTCFGVMDSGMNFLMSLVLPSVAALILILLFAFFSRMAGSNYGEFSKTNVAIIISLLSTPAVFLGIYFIYCKVQKIDCFKASDINFKVNYQKVLIVIIISLVAVFLISPFITLFDYGCEQLFHYNPSNALSYTMDNGFRYVVGVLVMALVPAIAEELLFRGLIQRGLFSKFNPHIAILLSATMFMLLHGSLQQTVFQFILGLVFGYATYYGGNLIYSMIMHFVNNFVVVTMSFVYTLQKVDVNAPAVYNTAWDYCWPVLALVIAAGIIVGLIFLLKYVNNLECKKQLASSANEENSTEEIADNKKVKNSSKNIDATKNTEVVSEQKSDQAVSETEDKTNKKLSKQELLWLLSGFVLGAIIWIVNTCVFVPKV